MSALDYNLLSVFVKTSYVDIPSPLFKVDLELTFEERLTDLIPPPSKDRGASWLTREYAASPFLALWGEPMTTIFFARDVFGQDFFCNFRIC